MDMEMQAAKAERETYHNRCLESELLVAELRASLDESAKERKRLEMLVREHDDQEAQSTSEVGSRDRFFVLQRRTVSVNQTRGGPVFPTHPEPPAADGNSRGSTQGSELSRQIDRRGVPGILRPSQSSASSMVGPEKACSLAKGGEGQLES